MTDKVRTIKSCCPKMVEATTEKETIEADTETPDLANVNGCCGGGCYVASEIRFCPWCGKKIETLDTP